VLKRPNCTTTRSCKDREKPQQDRRPCHRILIVVTRGYVGQVIELTGGVLESHANAGRGNRMIENEPPFSSGPGPAPGLTWQHR
jgi:hypothetical protein